ncbi:hypothetical protein V2P38_00060 [Mesomycoplasma hyorhinis]|uniref:hypothetical protein n=1 Tax=Mesomycoplasma hyorhinis TaxID=2100 RepID=UPI003DA3EBAD
MKSNDDLQKLGLFFFQINNKNFDHFTFNFLKGEDTLIYSSDEQLWNKFKQILTKSVNYNGIIFNDGEILDNLKNKNKFYFNFLSKNDFEKYKDYSIFNFLKQRFAAETNSECLKQKYILEKKYLQEKHINFELAFFEQQNYSKLLNLIIEKLDKEIDESSFSESNFLYVLKKIWILIWQFKSSYFQYYQEKIDDLIKFEKPYLNFISKLDKNLVSLNSVVDIYYLEHYKHNNILKNPNNNELDNELESKALKYRFISKWIKKKKVLKKKNTIYYFLKKLIISDIKEASQDARFDKNKLIKVYFILNKKFLKLWKYKFIFNSKNSFDLITFYDYWYSWLHTNFAKIVDNPKSDKTRWVKSFFNVNFKTSYWSYKTFLANLLDKFSQWKIKNKEKRELENQIAKQKEEIREKFQNSHTYWTYLNSLYEQKSTQNWIKDSIIKNFKLHSSIREENEDKLKRIKKILFELVKKHTDTFADLEFINSFCKETFENIQNREIKSSHKNNILNNKYFYNFILEKEIISFCEKNNFNHGVLFKKYKELNEEQKINLECSISQWFHYEFYFLNTSNFYFEPNSFIDHFLRFKKQNQSLIIFSNKFLRPQFLNFLFIEKNKIIESFVNNDYKPEFETTFANYFFNHHDFDLDLLKDLPTKKYDEFYYQNVEFSGFNKIKNIWEEWSDKIQEEKSQTILNLQKTLEKGDYPIAEDDIFISDIKIQKPKLDINLKEKNGK